LKKIHYNWQQIESACLDIAKQMNSDNYLPDYIVGIGRGGLVPATLLSHYIGVPMQSLDISLRDSGETTSNCGMAEDAYYGKKILIVDDINDQGTTIAWIKKDWESLCCPEDTNWSFAWTDKVRFATLHTNLASNETVNYSFWEINKAEEDCWIVYPWEEFWKC
jgi:hypoxanthine phosphoribosyltransferase